MYMYTKIFTLLLSLVDICNPITLSNQLSNLYQSLDEEWVGQWEELQYEVIVTLTM